MNTRAKAALIVYQVVDQQRSLSQLKKTSNAEDHALIQELSFGTLRWYYRLEFIAKKLLLSPLKKKYQDVFCLLLVGLYQLMYTSIPEYAAVSETVHGAKSLKKLWATGLLNKTLRRFLKEKDSLLSDANHHLSSHYAHPDWLIHRFQKVWPTYWESILTANNDRAPMTLRVNSQKTTREKYLAALEKNNITAFTLPELPHAIQLESPVPVSELPDFEKGFVYVQDSAGQFAAPLLNSEPGQRVLDACAAPGSKTTHIMELAPDIEHLIAIDKDPMRLKTIEENIKRLGLSNKKITLLAADAAETTTWWDKKPFDRILLDAPCSATGIIRRHPDIKLLRKETDIKNQADEQLRLLNALWPLLKPNGLLLYSTCSILPDENESVIAAFLANRDDAKELPVGIPNSFEQTHGRQLFPTIGGHDGFYYALLQKGCGD